MKPWTNRETDAIGAMLVTGGAGFIVAAFVRQMLNESDWRVVNLDKLTCAGNLESLQGDVQRAESLLANCSNASWNERGRRTMPRCYQGVAPLGAASDQRRPGRNQ